MKRLFIILLFTISSVFAASFSEIETVVRASISYQMALADIEIDIHEDIWGISIIENIYPKSCDAMVEGYGKRKVPDGTESAYRFTACIKPTDMGFIKAEFSSMMDIEK